jgi:hypothetical protein
MADQDLQSQCNNDFLLISRSKLVRPRELSDTRLGIVIPGRIRLSHFQMLIRIKVITKHATARRDESRFYRSSSF